MIELENKEARVLAAARRGLASTEADRERVRLKIASALASGEIPDEAPELDAPRSATLFKAALGLGLAVLAVGGGYATGHRAGFAAGVREGAATVSPARPSAASQQEVVVQREHAVPVAATPPVAHAAPSSSAAARRATASTSAALSDATPPSSASDLDEELRTLRRVERAQRAGNPRLALALLDELDRDRPRGKLLEERAAARAVAECQSTFGDSRAALLARFRARYPSSVYSSRVETACAETEPRPPGDSSIERESSR